MKKGIKMVLGTVIALLTLCVVFVVKASAAELGTYTYADDTVSYTIVLEDDSKCTIAVTKGETTYNIDANFEEKENGNIYISAIDSEFKIGLANTLEMVSAESTDTTDDTTDLKLDEETLNKVLDVVSMFMNGDYKEALSELKVIFGIAGAFVIVCVLIAFLFIIKYFKQSAMYRELEAKLTDIQKQKLETAIDTYEQKTQEILDKTIAKMEALDDSKKEQLNSMVNAIDTKLNSLKK